jgi:hypothetical protein
MCFYVSLDMLFFFFFMSLLLAVVDKVAKPEDKTLDNLRKNEEEHKGYTTKIVPKIVRRNSFSAEFL